MTTVLVVDDEPASRRAVQRALADQCTVLAAAGAGEAWAMLAAQPVAVLVADQRMPGTSGIELLVQAAERYPDTVRVLLTGYTAVTTLVDAINAGHVYAYVSKPWEPHDLRLVVRRAAEVHAADRERRRLLRELEHACGRLRREAERKGRLLTVAAHELGTPLHVLTQALALAAAQEPAPAARDWLETAQRCALWLGRSLTQMVRAGRVWDGPPALQRRAMDVAALLQAVQRHFAPVAAARALTLRLEIAPALPRVHADARWLERALANLVGNAVRCTPDGGRITLAAATTAQAVELSVADSGVGIAAELLDELFEPFSPAAGDLSLHGSGEFTFGARGLGLGLAITKAIVDGHGGTIRVSSRPGCGSRFTIGLPLAAPASGKPAPAAAGSAG